MVTVASRPTPGPSTAGTACPTWGTASWSTGGAGKGTDARAAAGAAGPTRPGRRRRRHRLARSSPAPVGVALGPAGRSGPSGRRRRRPGQSDDWRGHLRRGRHRSAVRRLLGRHLKHTWVASRLSRRSAVVDAGIRAAGRSQRIFDDLVEMGLGDGRPTPVDEGVAGTRDHGGGGADNLDRHGGHQSQQGWCCLSSSPLPRRRTPANAQRSHGRQVSAGQMSPSVSAGCHSAKSAWNHAIM